MFSTLRFIVIIFPILIGTILTGVGTLKLSEANLVPTEQWKTPYGLLVFSTVPLESTAIHVEIIMARANLEKSLVPTQLELNFDLANNDKFKNAQEEIVIGFQFPFKIADYQEFEIEQRDVKPLIPIEKEAKIVEDEVGVTSLFYVRFKTLIGEWQRYHLLLVFDWEGPIRRESFSVFSIALPVTLGLEPLQIDYPYEQLPNIHYIYYADDLDMSVGMELPWEFEIKRSYPPTGTVITEFGSDSLSMFWEPRFSLEKRVSGKHLQMIMVEFEVSRLSETRDRLLFDSGLYMGLGVGLLFSGIHEVLKVTGERRKKS
jgi:hypothetical protein